MRGKDTQQSAMFSYVSAEPVGTLHLQKPGARQTIVKAVHEWLRAKKVEALLNSVRLAPLATRLDSPAQIAG
jgi:hypothetical protein